MSDKKKHKIRRVIILIGVLIIPLLYSYFYLGAFWDPYKTLKDVKVAVVNLDKGSNINNKERNLGNELAKELKKNDELSFVVTDKDKAYDGLLGDKYYATITIPKDFSKNISTANDTNKKQTKLIFSPNEKKNYLATQILTNAVSKVEKQTQEKITKEIVGTLTNEVKQTPIQLGKIENGLNALSKGSQDLNNGAHTLFNGTNTLANQYQIFNNANSELTKGTSEYINGVNEANSGAWKIKEGAEKLKYATNNFPTLINGANSLSNNLNNLDNNVKNYTSNVNNLITNYNNLRDLINLINNNSQVLNDPSVQATISALNNQENIEKVNYLNQSGTALSTGVNALNNGAKPLLNGVNKLNDLQLGINDLSTGANNLYSGTSVLSQKGNTLLKSTNQINNASNEINDALSTVNNGSNKLYNGTFTLTKGNIKATNEINLGIDDTNEKLKKLDGLDDFAAKTVSIEKKEVEAVPNYGTSFAPYFMSLSLWIGAIIIFFGIYLDSEGSYKLLSKKSDKPLIRTICYLAIGILQALVLGFVLKYALGLNVNHMGYYYLSIILVSLVFISIVQFFMVTFKDIGKFLSIVFLILQLTSCGGTFPMETVPKFFNVLYPFMPMTYSVNLFKETISGVATMTIGKNCAILSITFIFFVALTIIFAIIKKNKSKIK